MTQRTLAGLLAVPLLIGLWVAAAFESLPYVTYAPGLTVNVLGSNDEGKEIIQVDGHRTYRDDGELRMTTVYVSQPRGAQQPLRADARLDQPRPTRSTPTTRSTRRTRPSSRTASRASRR